jgi:hypothetical protein
VKLHKFICGLGLTIFIIFPIASFASDDLDDSDEPTAEGLNRLFTTPSERRKLDRARRFPSLPAFIRFDGISRVKGKHGDRTVIWVNGSSEFSHESVSIRTNANNSITVTLLPLRRSFVLLPGQTLDPVKLEVVEFYK